jgi:hypothetical protein
MSELQEGAWDSAKEKGLSETSAVELVLMPVPVVRIGKSGGRRFPGSRGPTGLETSVEYWHSGGVTESKLKYWGRLIAEQEASKQKIGLFCRERGISEPSFLLLAKTAAQKYARATCAPRNRRGRC